MDFYEIIWKYQSCCIQAMVEITQSINVSRTLWLIKNFCVRPSKALFWSGLVRVCVCRVSDGDVVVFECDYSCVVSTWRLFTGAALQQTDAVNPLCFCVQMSCFVYLWLSLTCCVCVLMLSWVTVWSLLSRGEQEHQEKLFSASPAGFHVPKPTADRINWQCYCELDT